MIAPLIYVSIAVLAGAACLFARDAMLRAAVYCALLLGVIAIWYGSLGHARPVNFLPWVTPPAGTVVAYRLDEPHAIYVWVDIADHAGPLSLRLPWNEQRAAALADAARAAKKNGTEVKMRGHERRVANGGSGGRHAKEKPMFYPAPPVALPAKTSASVED